MSVPVDSSDTSDEYHYYTLNLITGVNRQAARAAIAPDRYTTGNSDLKHNDTTNGCMSLPMWFRHSQKIMLKVDGTCTQRYLKIILNGTWAFITLKNKERSTSLTLFPT
jgi:hypothetical protein